MEHTGFDFSQLSAKLDSIHWMGFSSCNQFEILNCSLQELTDTEILVKSLKSGFLEDRYIDREIKHEWHSEHKSPILYGPVFPDKLEISDFRLLNASELIERIVNFINSPDWGDDRNAFITLFDKVRQEYNDMWKQNSIFFLNCDDLPEGKKQLEKEMNFYDYFLLLIVPERDRNVIHVQCFGED